MPTEQPPTAAAILAQLRAQAITQVVFAKSSLEPAAGTALMPPPLPPAAEWLAVFQSAAPLVSVVALTVNLRKANWDQAVLAAALQCFPNLTTLTLTLNPSQWPTLHLSLPKLTQLQLLLEKRNYRGTFTLTGHLPQLADFQLTHTGPTQIAVEPLATVLVAAAKTLAHIGLVCPQGWPLAQALGQALRQHAPTAQPHFSVRRTYKASEAQALSSPAATAHHWQALCALKNLGFEIELNSLLALVTDAARFAEIQDYLAPRATALFLQGEHHSFLIATPALLQNFTRLVELEIFDAQALTQTGFEWLTTHLPQLKTLRLLNNHNPEFAVLALHSQTLTGLVLTHFHQLTSYQINCPSLETLELDNCSEVTNSYPTLENKGETRWCNGNFGERFLADLLNGAPHTQLPALKRLTIWHNHNTLGTPLVLEPLRLAVACRAGHPQLETLALYRLSHLQALTLQHLPHLKQLVVYDDFEPGAGWLETLNLVDLPANCVVEINCLSATPKHGLALAP